uniref:Intracellular sulfur oxidation protein DsrH n=1 Tax=uncultured bacterium ws085G8 TaxID=1131825 RepID=I1X5A7_9BACT|nr:intracellular sulfur oxidation protein DsrH [uncultured bacterium ws085G8]
MSKMLHLVNKSPFDRNALDSCLRLATAGSSVLLLEDGVYAALNKATSAEAVKERMDDMTFYVLGPDVSARGLDDTPLIDGINVVDYGGFVDLVVEHEVSQSWL